MNLRTFASAGTAVIVLVGGLASGCAKKPAAPMSPERFAELYTAVLMATVEASEDSAAADSVAIMQQVLAEHGVTQREFDEAVAYFQSQPQLWREVFEAVVARLKEIKSERASSARPSSAVPTNGKGPD